jgi:hypothetical protein
MMNRPLLKAVLTVEQALSKIEVMLKKLELFDATNIIVAAEQGTDTRYFFAAGCPGWTKELRCRRSRSSGDRGSGTGRTST